MDAASREGEARRTLSALAELTRKSGDNNNYFSPRAIAFEMKPIPNGDMVKVGLDSYIERGLVLKIGYIMPNLGSHMGYRANREKEDEIVIEIERNS